MECLMDVHQSPVFMLISGGQTGVDRAALDIAMEFNIPVAGWCPRGRKAEDGIIDPTYPLRETPSERPAQRTAWNVRDSDGTLIISPRRPSGGTALTVRLAQSRNKPHLVVNPLNPHSVNRVLQWLRKHDLRILNVAGPRESSHPGIYQDSVKFLKRILATFK